ncbi:transcriptional regulator NrdR [Frankia torreyi]|uniref:Transcriptional repressor NrdR n=1 Tax=Frankia torreyi TaxID=1856 RepID=A0A0D8BKZ2_9ACTN|nr:MULTISPECIES: transcriptional regulator NrdR [Frankia]KJE24654.1 transcriptional regulator NrdR [Frankia torreyi]KQC37633.1 transcriptional regulator NrdR [Frankia sp. ACN1ag]KQM07641.1 transcriptional regulator NrdR [Frankia sp. CpI1-P]
MRCPFCRHPDSRVVDSREAEEGSAIRRRRSCLSCGRRFTTMEEASLRVLKRSGVAEPFSRAKVITGVRKACQGRPVRDDDLALLAQRVEDAVRSSGSAEVPAEAIGRAILGPLRELDEVAYLRFASVYLAFESLGDFESAIAALRAETSGTRRGAEPDDLDDLDELGDPAVRPAGGAFTDPADPSQRAGPAGPPPGGRRVDPDTPRPGRPGRDTLAAVREPPETPGRRGGGNQLNIVEGGLGRAEPTTGEYKVGRARGASATRT